MSPIKAFLPVFAALFISAGALAADAPAAPPANGPGWGQNWGPGMGPGMGRRGGCRGIMRFLSPEEHMMHFREMHPANMGSMTVDAYRAFRKAKCDKFMAMSQDDLQKYAAELKAKWNALPDSEKVKMYEQMNKFRGGMRGRGGRHGGGYGRGMGPGWK